MELLPDITDSIRNAKRHLLTLLLPYMLGPKDFITEAKWITTFN
jgi:hypothetical protein